MKDELSVYYRYRMFEKEFLPLLNFCEDQEKKILGKRTILNKAKCHQEIIRLYEKYRLAVRESWKMIYASDEEYNKMAKNTGLLLQGQSVCAETDIQWMVEQFFFWLSMSIIYVIMMYKGEENESVATDESNKARDQMHKMMARIDEEGPRKIKKQVFDKTKNKKEEQIADNNVDYIKQIEKDKQSKSQEGLDNSVLWAEENKNKLDNLFNRMRDIEIDYEKYAEVVNPSVDFDKYGDKWAALSKEARSQLNEIKTYINHFSKQSKSNEPLGFESERKLDESRKALDLFTDYTDSMNMLMLHLDQKAHGKAYSIDDYLKEMESTITKRKQFVSVYNSINYVPPKQPIEKTITKSDMTGLSDDPLEYFVKNHDEKPGYQDIKADRFSSTKLFTSEKPLRSFLIIAVLIVVFFNIIAFIPGKKPYTGSSNKIYAASYDEYNYLLVFNSSHTMALCRYRESPTTASGYKGRRTYYEYDATCYNRIGPISICPRLSLFFWKNIIIGQKDNAAKIHLSAFRNDFLGGEKDSVYGSYDEVLIDHGYGIEIGKLCFFEITDSTERKYAVSVWNIFNEFASQVS